MLTRYYKTIFIQHRNQNRYLKKSFVSLNSRIFFDIYNKESHPLLNSYKFCIVLFRKFTSYFSNRYLEIDDSFSLKFLAPSPLRRLTSNLIQKQQSSQSGGGKRERAQHSIQLNFVSQCKQTSEAHQLSQRLTCAMEKVHFHLGYFRTINYPFHMKGE
ncbi:hypothetical protein CEXT_370521 [Caerostris extrusa]|uniref:Uncharacterized protein n=1 Tax=Caerostris extrusa TaxID=172846 RepID=A0AAV4NRY5_CAEEX|nr:hypothetical protein CEXT_370521 [Caerostris extrusa]